jgi:hypothetical protein
VKAVERLAKQAAFGEQRLESRGVPATRERTSPQWAITRFSPVERYDIGQRSNRRDLEKVRQELGPRPLADISACTTFRATPTPARPFSG